MRMTRNGSEVARISRCQRVETKTPRMKTGPPIMIKRKDGVDQIGGKMRMGMKTLLLLRILLEAKRRTETIASADEMAAGTEGVVTTIAIRSHAEIAMKTSHPAGIVTVKTIEKLLKMVVTMTRRERGAVVDAIVMVMTTENVRETAAVKESEARSGGTRPPRTVTESEGVPPVKYI